MMAMVLLLVASCKKTDDPSKKPDPVDPDATKLSTVIGAGYYYAPGDVEGLNAHYLGFMFATEGVSLDSEGYLTAESNGKVVSLEFLSASVDANFFPATGEYVVSEDQTAGTVFPGSSYYGMSDVGTYIYTIKDGKISSNVYYVEEGKVTISGNAGNCTINMDFGEGGKYAFTGAIEIEDNRPDPDEPYLDEPKTKGTVTVTATDATLTFSTSYAQFMLEGVSQDNVYAYIFGNYETTWAGSYTVGTDSDDMTPGTVMYSAGVSNNSVTPSFVGEIDAEGYFSGDIYFIVGGSITVTDGGEDTFSSTGSFTSYFGSTINVTLSGSVVDFDAQQGGEEIASRRILRRR